MTNLLHSDVRLLDSPQASLLP